MNQIRKNKNHNRFAIIMMSIGMLLCLYPSIRSFYERYCHEQLMKTYHYDVKQATSKDLSKEWEKAQSYNDVLFNSHTRSLTTNEIKMLQKQSYEKLLNINENGIMAELVIPKISLDLPIYHGTTQTILEEGIGHVYGSSLPIGGTNTRCLLTGHRGLPSSMLFTRLDELKKNDTFYINVLNKTLWYRIEQIDVILPDEVETLSIKEQEDIVSLITCTPYGVNSHRLVISAKRFTPKKHSTTHIQHASLPSARELLFLMLPFVFLLFIMHNHKRRRLRRKRS